MAETLAAAETINGFSAPALQLIKELVNRSFESGLKEGETSERCVFHAVFGTDDQREGMDAFLNKRAPVFRHGKR
ncbi:enoyl-CoA hydratase-related protein [Paucibacter sp. DJ2R-2]|uniref:enoyl-CoA hydratase-related protein n=1 Tax=Paucibacter sp. DJ2R-2 TaxID=2893558 RepID=UPI002961E842|nr:enoyl-CoA hydratase-related protein [Paucibacter sp. DJ2R-2]